MDFNKARTFVEVVDAGTITKAGKRLRRSQQALSYQLSALEDELGLVLFRRHGPKLSLTQEGRAFYSECRRHLLSLEESLVQLKAATKTIEGTLRIGLWLEQGVGSLPSRLHDFCTQYPSVRAELFLGTDQDIEQKLLTEEIDVGFFVYIKDRKSITSTPVFKRRLVLVASKNYLESRSAIRNFRDCLNLDLIDYHRSHESFKVWIRKNSPKLYQEALKKEAKYQVDNDLVMKSLVLQGLGASILPEEIIEQELASGVLKKILPRKAEALEAVIDMGTLKRRTPRALLEAFLQHFPALEEAPI